MKPVSQAAVTDLLSYHQREILRLSADLMKVAEMVSNLAKLVNSVIEVQAQVTAVLDKLVPKVSA